MQHGWLEDLSGTDWEALNNKNLSFASKSSVVRDRAFRMKLIYPSQKTVKHMVTTIAAVHKPDATPSQLFDWVIEAKESFDSGRLCIGTPAQTQAMASMLIFPSGPAGLPSELRTAVYQDSPPIAPVIHNLSSFAASCTSRGTWAGFSRSVGFEMGVWWAVSFLQVLCKTLFACT